MQLQINQLTKSYRRGVFSLQNINLTLNPGILGLLGPNGAGKSTLMRILATITLPTTGQVLWDGVDIVRSPDKLRTVLGYLPQDFGVYPHLSAIEFLSYMAALKGLDAKTAKARIDELLVLVNLTKASKQALGSYSGGMRQRVGIAQALLNDPQLLIVDEPTVGLDPEERVRFRNLLSDLSGERIVILSTHIVSDVESVATDIAILKQGELLIYCSPEQLLQKATGHVFEVIIPSTEVMKIREKYLISGTIRRSDGVHVRIVADTPPELVGVKTVEATLEDAYLYMNSMSTTVSDEMGKQDLPTLQQGGGSR